MSETRILLRLLQMYIPRNWEFGPAFLKLRNFGGGGVEPPKHQPWVRQCWTEEKCNEETELNRTMYVQRNIESRTCNCSSGKSLSYMFWECVYSLRYPACAMLSAVACQKLRFFHFISETARFYKKKITGHKMFFFYFLYNFCLKYFSPFEEMS
jgi:hypothetical protein